MKTGCKKMMSFLNQYGVLNLKNDDMSGVIHVSYILRDDIKQDKRLSEFLAEKFQNFLVLLKEEGQNHPPSPSPSPSVCTEIADTDRRSPFFFTDIIQEVGRKVYEGIFYSYDSGQLYFLSPDEAMTYSYFLKTHPYYKVFDLVTKLSNQKWLVGMLVDVKRQKGWYLHYKLRKIINEDLKNKLLAKGEYNYCDLSGLAQQNQQFCLNFL